MNDFDEQLRKLIHMERHNFAGSSSRAIVELVNLIFDFAIKIRASEHILTRADFEHCGTIFQW